MNFDQGQTASGDNVKGYANIHLEIGLCNIFVSIS